MQLSPLEDRVFSGLRKAGLSVFTVKDICLLFGFSETKAYNTVKALKKKRAIESVKAGLYSLRGTNDFVVGAYLNWPSYLSFWSALNYYGFSDQLPKTIFFASAKYKRKTGAFKYVRLSKKRFFGYVSVGEIVVAEKEKAFIDCLLFPKHAGGAKEVFNSLSAGLKQISVEKLVDYALRVESRAVARRLGFLLDSLGCEEKLLQKLLERVGKGFELLDPSVKKKNAFNKKWLLDANW